MNLRLITVTSDDPQNLSKLSPKCVECKCTIIGLQVCLAHGAGFAFYGLRLGSCD